MSCSKAEEQDLLRHLADKTHVCGRKSEDEAEVVQTSNAMVAEEEGGGLLAVGVRFCRTWPSHGVRLRRLDPRIETGYCVSSRQQQSLSFGRVTMSQYT